MHLWCIKIHKVSLTVTHNRRNKFSSIFHSFNCSCKNVNVRSLPITEMYKNWKLSRYLKDCISH